MKLERRHIETILPIFTDKIIENIAHRERVKNKINTALLSAVGKNFDSGSSVKLNYEIYLEGIYELLKQSDSVTDKETLSGGFVRE